MTGGRDVVAEHTPTATTVASGRKIVVAIGIDRYRSQRWPALRNAVRDAVGATRAFQQLGFEEVVPPLLDERATGGAIEQLVTDELDRELRPEDSLVVFYAGHGGVRSQPLGTHEVNTGYLVPVDAGEPYASWIELKPWLEQIARLPARHILVVLDACKSGIALSDALRRTRDSDTVLARPFAAASRKRSRLLITSADEGELALDSGPRLGHSLFTGCLIEALVGGEVPRFVHDGRPMTIGSNLGHHVRTRVQTYAREPSTTQTPVVGRFQHDERGEMLIPVMVDEDRESSRLLAQGSNPLPVTTSDAATGGSADVVAPPAIEDRPRRTLRLTRGHVATVVALVALAGAALAAAGWRPPAVEPSRAGSDRPARNELTDPQVSVLAAEEATADVQPGLTSADAGTGSARGTGADAAVGPAKGEGSGGSAGSAQQNHGGGVGAPARRSIALAPAASPRRDDRAAARVAVAQPKACSVRCDAPKGGTVAWHGQIVQIPGVLVVPCGVEVDLVIAQPHHVPGLRKVTATPTTTKAKSFRLIKIQAEIQVISKPPKANILLGNVLLGVTPTTIKLPEAETVTVTIAKPGYASSDNKLTPGVDAKLSVELTRLVP